MAFDPAPEYRILIMKYLTHSVSTREEHELRHWVDQHPDHAAYFERLYNVWDQLQALPQAAPPKIDDAWNRLTTFLPESASADRPANRIAFFSVRLALVTMLMVVVLGSVGWYVFKNEKIVPFELQPQVPGLVYLQTDTVYAYVNGGIIPVGETLDDQFSIQGEDSHDPYLSVFVRKDTLLDRWEIQVKEGYVLLQTRQERVKLSEDQVGVYFPYRGEILVKPKAP